MMTGDLLLRAADLVDERPYLSPVTAAAFRSGHYAHESGEAECAGGPHCWITLKARDVLAVVGEAMPV